MTFLLREARKFLSFSVWNGRGMGEFLGVGWAILVPWEVLWDRKTSIVGPATP